MGGLRSEGAGGQGQLSALGSEAENPTLLRSGPGPELPGGEARCMLHEQQDGESGSSAQVVGLKCA